MITIGIDPGLYGSIGILLDGKYQNVHDMPVVIKASKRMEVNPAEIYAIIKSETSPYFDCEVALEKVAASPQMGVSSAFSFGDSFGCVRSVIACCNLGTNLVSPSVWKRHFKLDKEKELSRALAIRLFPEAPLSLKKHSDRAEALLMARWLWETMYA
jgi:hypothetical protein